MHFSHYQQQETLHQLEGSDIKDPYSDKGFPFLHSWAKLIRLHSPIGWYLLLLPCYMGMSAAVTTSMISLGADWVMVGAPLLPPQLATWLVLGAFTMRSAGCIVNDMWDREYDKQVARTKNRPLASGELQMWQAAGILMVHLTIGLVVVAALNPYAVALSFGVVPFAALYPLAKRFTFYPQVVLGCVFNWGIFVGYAALCGNVNWWVCVPLYTGCVLWTVVYDTVYAFQDLKDDEKIGVKSTARLLKGQKNKLYLLLPPMCACFVASGISADQSALYYIGIGASMYYLFSLLENLRERDAWSCANFFRRNARFGVFVIGSWCLGNFGWVLFIQFSTILDDAEKQGKESLLDKTAAELAAPPKKTFWERMMPGHAETWADVGLFLVTGGSESFNKEVKETQVRNSPANVDMLDRWMKPSFVYLQQHPGAQVEDIPPHLRKEYFGQNVTDMLIFLRLVAPENGAAWKKWFYDTSDHYTFFSRGF